MSMTILSAPASGGVAAHNDMMYVIDSSNKASSNYKYILDVYIASIKVATMKNRPNPIYGDYGVFNVAKVVQNYLTSRYFIPSGVTAMSITGHKVDYQVKLSESWSTSGNVNVVTDSTRKGYNASMKMLDFIIGYTLVDIWNSTRPRTNDLGQNNHIDIEEDGNYYLTVFKNTADSYVITSYDGYNGTGSVLATITNSISADCIINCRSDLYALNNPLSYKVELKAGSTVLDTVRFNICDSTAYDTIPLHFMNRKGGYETVYFRLVSKKSIDVDRKMLQEQGYTVRAGAVVYKDANNVLYDGVRPYSATSKDTWKLTAEATSDAENEWFEELHTSTAIYTEVGSLFVPVMIKEGSYEKKKRLTDGITNIGLTIEFGQVNNSQFR